MAFMVVFEDGHIVFEKNTFPLPLREMAQGFPCPSQKSKAVVC
jgi:hypothetical protein